MIYNTLQNEKILTEAVEEAKIKIRRKKENRESKRD